MAGSVEPIEHFSTASLAAFTGALRQGEEPRFRSKDSHVALSALNLLHRFGRSGVAVSTFAPIALAQGESVVVVVKVYPGVGREDELQARYLKQAEFLRRSEPNASFRLHRSTKEPVTFLWYETYESQAALENHLRIVMPAFRKEFGATPEGLVARPSDSETYRELAK